MDETGQGGGVTPGGNGNGAVPHGERADRGGKADGAGQARLNGWAAVDAVWSNAGAALEPAPEPVQPTWRNGPADGGSGHGWADAPRYADLLAPLSPAPQQQPPQQAQPHPSVNGADSTPVALRVPSSAPPYPYEGDLEDAARVAGMSEVTPVPPIAVDRPAPPVQAAHPPQPEGPRHGAEVARHGADALPTRRPAPPPESAAPGQPPQAPSVPPVVPPRPSFGPTASRSQAGAPMTPQQWREARDAGKSAAAADVPPGFRPQPSYERPGYDTSLYERPVSPPAPSRPAPPVRSASPAPARPAATWAQEWPQPERAPEPPPAEPRTAGRPTDLASDPRTGPSPQAAPPAPPGPATTTSQVAPPPPPRTPEPDALPQRVPAEPDVPTAPEPPAESPADGPDLTRIWSHLRRDDVQPRERPEGFDVQAILAAVRGVEGVQDASLRTTEAGAHSLRLDLADGADPAEVSRIVARLLQDRMGLAAAPKEPSTAAQPARARTEPTATGSFPAPAGSYLPAQQGGPVAEQRRPAPETPRRRARRAREESPLGQSAPVEPAPPRPLPPGKPGPRIVIDEVQVSTFGLDATVEVKLAAEERRAIGRANGPAVDAYVLRLCAEAGAAAVDDLLSTAEQVGDRGKCFVEHAAVVPFGSCEVAVVVVLLVCGGWVEQLAGSALVAGDPRQAVVRATLNAVNRRLEALLA
ncbi:hypothetical protein RB614_02815 [Phytohabitans sp. ZYX-F-186]|uniref:Uncharacterized protein n=1 Tax=Phytohabitans maris TaxID=3071409 RepID=A0ABU0Z8Q7_9ACTN|nr:hypothetical protein [Phytohabitans sp. ZYX-F-186]MDQ7903445.1 hypothetical protein [Phytohabitans sp. ZYX-F-186]